MKLLITLVVLYIIYRLIKAKIKKYLQNIIDSANSDANEQVDDIMVKDPCCGIYFPKRYGIYANIKGEDLLFCSEECRDKFVSKNC